MKAILICMTNMTFLKQKQQSQHLSKSNYQGFTIIEVVLVLAIAGLIFLMVFIALPALQRSQRDQARRTDVGLVAAAIRNWRSNNRGITLKSETALDIHEEDDDGTKWGTVADSTQLGPYLKDTLSNNTTSVGIYDATNSAGRYRIGPSDTEGHITVSAGRKCPRESDIVGNTYNMPAGKPSDAAVIIILETGGFYCENTQ